MLRKQGQLGRSRRDGNSHFLHIGHHDILIHHLASYSKALSDRDYTLRLNGLYDELEGIPVPRGLTWIPFDSMTFDQDLISYYMTGSVLLYAPDFKFQKLLLSMSFTDTSSSSVAVRQALYALTALSLYGYDTALHYQTKAMKALYHAYSMQENSSTKDRLQHIAAGLLLAAFEVISVHGTKLLDTNKYQMNDSPHGSKDWAIQVCNAKKAANYVYSLDRTYQGDVRTLLEWIFYHDAISRFSTSHWAKRSPGMVACMNDHQLRQAVQLSGDQTEVTRPSA